MESDSYGVVITTEIGVESNKINITRYSKGSSGKDVARHQENHMQKIFTCKDKE